MSSLPPKHLRAFPVHAVNKTPLVDVWKEAATTDERQIFNWSKQFPNCGWGFPTGQANNLFVLDFDKKSGGLETYKAITDKFGGFLTREHHTQNGGIHVLFRFPDRGAFQTAGVLPGLDTRSEGGYIVGPPTPGYSVLTDEQVGLIDPDLLAYLQTLKDEKKQKTVSVQANSPADAQNELQFGEGERNQGMAVLAGRLQRMGCLTLSGLNELNERYCFPPLPEQEIETMFNHFLNSYDVTLGVETQPVELKEKIFDPVQDLTEAYSNYVNDERKVVGTPTGIHGLDKLLGGGLREGEILAVLAQAKIGKSSFVHKIIHKLLDANIPVGYASREMDPATEVVPNLLSIAVGKNALKKGAVSNPAQVMAAWELYFSRGFGFFPIEEITSWVLELISRGVKHFVFDHLIHFVDDEDYKLISKFSRALKKLATEHSVSFVLVIQPKNLMQGEKVTFQSIRGGAAVGQAVNSVVVLERHRDELTHEITDITKVTLDIARHKLARPGSIYVQYDRETMDFTEVEPERSSEASRQGPTRVVNPREDSERVPDPLTSQRYNRFDKRLS